MSADAARRDGKRAACGLHGPGSGTPEPPDKETPIQQQGVVEVGDRRLEQARLGTQFDFRREPALHRGDGGADDRVQQSAERVSREHEHGPSLVTRNVSEPHVAATRGLGLHDSVPYRDS